MDSSRRGHATRDLVTFRALETSCGSFGCAPLGWSVDGRATSDGLNLPTAASAAGRLSGKALPPALFKTLGRPGEDQSAG